MFLPLYYDGWLPLSLPPLAIRHMWRMVMATVAVGLRLQLPKRRTEELEVDLVPCHEEAHRVEHPLGRPR